MTTMIKFLKNIISQISRHYQGHELPLCNND